MNRFSKEESAKYKLCCRLANAALPGIQERLKTAISSLGDRFLVRAKIDPPRVKSPESLIRKARERSWTITEALAKAQDFVGFRIVCNNLQDVYRVVELIEAALTHESLKVQRYDYIAEPKEDGYRAIHLVFRFPVKLGKDEATFGCEVQVRSLLQSGWAELSREDLYGNRTDIPPSIAKRMKALSRNLARADAIADELRTRLAKPRRGHKPVSGQPLTASTIAFIYRRAFGEPAPEYVVQAFLSEFGGQEIRSDALDAVLADKAFMAKLVNGYKEYARWEPEPYVLFRCAAISVLRGTDAAIRLARAWGKSDWQEVDQIARSEARATLPDDPDSFIAELEYRGKDEDPISDIETWALGLGGRSQCTYCGTTIVDPDELADGAIHHFKLRGSRAEMARERISRAVINSGVDTGSWGSSTLCSGCGYMLNKDD